MNSRRTPSGQGPARTAVRPGRAPGTRAVGRRGPVRAVRADSGVRAGTRDDARTGLDGDRRRAPAAVDPRASRRAPVRRRGAARRARAVSPRRVSGRATVLGLLLLALALAYAYPVRVYLAQQAQIAQLQAAQAAQRQRIAQLNDQLAKWNDDQYVIAEAHRRLHYVAPGQVAYVVVDGQNPAAGNGSGPTPGTAPWFSQLWSNIQAADNRRTR